MINFLMSSEAGNLDSLDEGRRRPRRPRTRISIRTNQRPGERGDAANATTAAAIDV